MLVFGSSRAHDTHDTTVRYHGTSRHQYLPYLPDGVFSNVIRMIPSIPRYFEMPVPTVPDGSGIPETLTYDSDAYHGTGYPGEHQGYARYGTAPCLWFPW